ncbi:hypothetical protein OG389_22770 [Streptomyces sp. NBC_00435]|uniref:hypothetical protein n=1 Tax=Streptomyces sp. NBC_00435 TaxID=2903649 RepID=UPI002E229BF3
MIARSHARSGTRERAATRMRLTSTSLFELELSSGMPSGDPVLVPGIAGSVTPWTWAAGYTIATSATYAAAE